MKIATLGKGLLMGAVILLVGIFIIPNVNASAIKPTKAGLPEKDTLGD